MELKILTEYIEKITENRIATEKDLDFSNVCDDMISIAYNKGILKGLSIAVQILKDMLDKEIETMAAYMEGENNE